MRTRWRFNEGAAIAWGGSWLMGGFVVSMTVVLATPRHSTASRIALLVWLLPILLAVFGVLLVLFLECFDERPSFGLPWRRVREPVLEDLRASQKM